MSDIEFNGQDHTVTLKDRNGNVVATWDANNRTDSAATLQFVPNGRYPVLDQNAPHRHPGDRDTVNGEYGTQGIIRFNVPGHDGVGIHAGRQNRHDRTPEAAAGVDHVTEGCIRTNEDAMQAIANTMRNDPLRHITVRHNRNQRRR